jgi:hypothetical protein
MTVMGRLKHAWNVFMNVNPVEPFQAVASYGTRPDRLRSRYVNEKTIYQSILARLAIDVSAIKIQHVRVDDEERFDEVIKSGLNSCLNLEANIDQAGREFRMDIALSLFEEGFIAIVPTDVTADPLITGAWDILTMRVGRITQWYPEQVRVSVYNEKTGLREEVLVDKRYVAIVTNPLYSVMNEPNSTLQRLIRKLSMLDAVDEQSSSGKLDLIIQLPYTIRSEAKREQAEQRRKDIEFQLKGSQYGIAYVDGTEKVVQLNRPSENNLMKQVEWLTSLLYSQLGITTAVMDGTASAAEMQNYYNRTLEPILTAITEAMIRSFLTKTARTQGQSIAFFYDPFKVIPLDQIADIVDKLTRNEVLSSNEFRQIFGRKPSKDPKADQLRNSNMPQSELGQQNPPALPPKQPVIKVASQRVPELPS